VVGDADITGTMNQGRTFEEMDGTLVDPAKAAAD
jgi:hypothetical protein